MWKDWSHSCPAWKQKELTFWKAKPILCSHIIAEAQWKKGNTVVSLCRTPWCFTTSTWCSHHLRGFWVLQAQRSQAETVGQNIDEVKAFDRQGSPLDKTGPPHPIVPVHPNEQQWQDLEQKDVERGPEDMIKASAMQTLKEFPIARIWERKLGALTLTLEHFKSTDRITVFHGMLEKRQALHKYHQKP